METKWLTIQSFKRNQSLIDHLNKLLVNYKLDLIGEKGYEKPAELNEAKVIIKTFLEKILNFTNQTVDDKALLGIDSRLRSFVRSFQEAKTRKKQFKSELFKENPGEILKLIDNPESDSDLQTLINSFAELRTIIETHSSTDLKELLESI